MIPATGQKYVVVCYTPLYIKSSFSSNKYCDILSGTIVQYNGIADEVDSAGNIWHNVIYRTNTNLIIGYLPDNFIEPYLPSFDSNIIKIANATQSDSDFAQDVIYKGNVLFNLCGEFSVLYCTGWRDFDIEEWLDEWKIKSPSYFNRIFFGGKSKPTSLDDITNMFQSFDGYPKTFKLISSAFVYNGKSLFTPYKVLEVLRNYRLLMGCKIESQYGRLRSTGIPHWIVLDKIYPIARGGMCDVYNPIVNGIESDYSWDDLISSCGKIPYGILVER